MANATMPTGPRLALFTYESAIERCASPKTARTLAIPNSSSDIRDAAVCNLKGELATEVKPHTERKCAGSDGVGFSSDLKLDPCLMQN
jgi:hypothetical protein